MTKKKKQFDLLQKADAVGLYILTNSSQNLRI